MASLVRNMLRTTSSRESDSGRTPTSPLSPFSGGIASVPSFNDFSMHVGQEAETELESGPFHSRGYSIDLPPGYFSQRSSIDVDAEASRASFEARSSMDATMRNNSWAPATATALHSRGPSLFQRSPSIAIPAASPSPSAGAQADSKMSAPAATAPARRKNNKPGKIDGMDYYEFCELIRSSSL